MLIPEQNNASQAIATEAHPLLTFVQERVRKINEKFLTLFNRFLFINVIG